jgi:hypothetical protein
VKKVALEQVSRRILLFSPVSNTAGIFHNHTVICHRRYITRAHDSVIKKRTLKSYYSSPSHTIERQERTDETAPLSNTKIIETDKKD